jgi:hypothetical protein
MPALFDEHVELTKGRPPLRRPPERTLRVGDVQPDPVAQASRFTRKIGSAVSSPHPKSAITTFIGPSFAQALAMPEPQPLAPPVTNAF